MPPPRKGDGWFYRVVDDNDFTDPETGVASTPVANPTAKKGTGIASNVALFPVSACRKVTIQVTWWHAISDFIQNQTQVQAINFDEEIADPGWINYVTVPKSGSINFRLLCGAYASNSFVGSPLGTLMTDLGSQVTTVLKAQPSSSGKSSASAPSH